MLQHEALIVRREWRIFEGEISEPSAYIVGQCSAVHNGSLQSTRGLMAGDVPRCFQDCLCTEGQVPQTVKKVPPIVDHAQLESQESPLSLGPVPTLCIVRAARRNWRLCSQQSSKICIIISHRLRGRISYKKNTSYLRNYVISVSHAFIDISAILPSAEEWL